MSDTTTIDVPRGLDSLNADDLALINQMRADEAANPEPEPTPAPERQAPPAAATPAAPEPEDLGLDDDEQQPGQRQDMVPHKNFHAVNERRKAAEARARELEQAHAAEKARLEERLSMLGRAIAAAPSAPATPAPAPEAPPAEEPLPDVNTDPIGHFRGVAEREARARGDLAKQVETLTSLVRGSQEAQTRQQQANELRQWGEAQERAFMATEPGYAEAMNWLRQSRHDELEAIGVEDPQQREQIINADITGIAVKARRDGASFPGRLFNLSQKRGWTKTPAAPAAPAIPALDAETPAATTPARQPNRDNTTTIGSLGSAPPARLSVEKLASMSERDFEAMIGKIKERGGDIRDVLGY